MSSKKHTAQALSGLKKMSKDNSNVDEVSGQTFEDKMSKIKAQMLDRKKVDEMLAGIGVALQKKRYNLDGISADNSAQAIKTSKKKHR